MKTLTKELVEDIFLDSIDSCYLNVIDSDNDEELFNNTGSNECGEYGLFEKVVLSALGELGYQSRAEFLLDFEIKSRDAQENLGQTDDPYFFEDDVSRLMAVLNIKLQELNTEENDPFTISENNEWWRVCFCKNRHYLAFREYFTAKRPNDDDEYY